MENTHKEEEITSVFNNHYICHADTDTKLVLHGEDDEKAKQGGIKKIKKQGSKGFCKLQVLEASSSSTASLYHIQSYKT